VAVPARDDHSPASQPQESAASEEPARSGGFWRGLREFVIIIVVALVISAVVRAFLIQAFYVPSASMEDTLQINDRIIASKITTEFGGVSRGEIVVFKDPGDWLMLPPPEPEGWRGTLQDALTFIGLLPSDSGNDLVKRVIGIGGDQVACCDAEGRIVVNGVALDEDYIIGPTDQVRFDVAVPQNSLFVMGDNRGNSRDSRFHLDINNGGVPVDNTVGRVVSVIWPFNRVSFEAIPEIFGNPDLNVSTTP